MSIKIIGNSSDGYYGPLDASGNLISTDGTEIFPTGIQGITGIDGFAGLGVGSQGNTGIGATGLQGVTGLKGIRGSTGVVASQGATGVQGGTGISIAGIVGLRGATGINGPTGPQGNTGTAGITGLLGTTGVSIAGIQGFQGLTGISRQGFTGIAGMAIQGATGIQGVTGIVSLQGATGIKGFDIQGATGLFFFENISFQEQTAGVTLLATIPANTLSNNKETVDFNVWGRLADATTLVEVTYGNDTLVSEVVNAPNTVFSGVGTLLRTSNTNQQSSITLTGINFSLIESILTSEDVTNSANLAISLSSAGTGHVIYALLVNKTP